MRFTRTLAAVALAAAPLAACSSTPAPTSTSTTSTPAASAPVTLDNGWVKATDKGMTGVFGTLTNTTDQPVHVTGGTTPIAGMVELHVTEKDASGAMVMKKSADGFTIPAKGTFELVPGANHIMLMGLKAPVETGVEVPIALTLDGGRTVTLTAQGRAYSGAKETYAPTATASAPASASSTGH